MSNKIKCSTCESEVFSCDKFTPKLPIGLICCKNCYINGSLSDHVKTQYKLIEKAILDELKKTHNQLEDTFQKYKKRFYKDQNKIFDTLINDHTFAFTKNFVQYNERIKSYDSRFQKIILNQISTIKSSTETQVKRILIEQVKKMNSLLGNEQKINKQNVSEVIQCGEFVRKVISPLSIKALRSREVVLKTFSTDQINECVRIFTSLTGEMNLKAEGFRQLEELGKEMLGEQRNLEPAGSIYTQVQLPQQKEQKKQNLMIKE